MKIMSWMELPILEQLFIGKKAVVFVKMPYGKVEKHAYKINEKNKLEVYAGYGTEGKKFIILVLEESKFLMLRAG